jgi:hypothetical protein
VQPLIDVSFAHSRRIIPSESARYNHLFPLSYDGKLAPFFASVLLSCQNYSLYFLLEGIFPHSVFFRCEIRC